VATVEIVQPSGDVVSIDVAARAHVVDVCDAARCGVPFSCRSASCGTCRVEVLAGAELLDPAEHDEGEVLAIFGVGAGTSPPQRLACQAVVRRGDGVVRLRAVSDDA
jgi:2Fe-2S ferredoxin